MCLSIPSRVIEVKGDKTAVVDTMGVRRVVSLELLSDDVKGNDWVLVHVGFAIQKLDEEEALKTIGLFEDILRMEEHEN
ncbi:MAG: HypC/HybG/HupF family hydrogenase formation chaperone [Aquificaceae bacterium]